MRSPFIDRRRDILPRTLRDLIAADAAQAAKDRPRRRQRRTKTVRRAP
ncbi:hypothetical protein [Actinomadura monticuli]|uniref:Transposase n=1 Tax=Actinomadura monticuli TaxID=3097367 RepID=A0ABV4QAZ7_9ACTN